MNLPIQERHKAPKTPFTNIGHDIGASDNLGRVNKSANETTAHAKVINQNNLHNMKEMQQSLDDVQDIIELFKQSADQSLPENLRNEFTQKVNKLAEQIPYEEYKKIALAYVLTQESKNKLAGKAVIEHNISVDDMGGDVDNPTRILNTTEMKFIPDNNLTGFITFINKNNTNSAPKHIQMMCRAVQESVCTGRAIIVSNQELQDIVTDLIDHADDTKKETMSGIIRFSSPKEYQYSNDPKKDAVLKLIIDTVNVSGQYKFGVDKVKDGIQYTKVKTIQDLKDVLSNEDNKNIVLHLRANIEDNGSISFSSTYKASELTLNTRAPVAHVKRMQLCLNHFALRSLNGRASAEDIKKYIESLDLKGLTPDQAEQVKAEKQKNYNRSDLYNINMRFIDKIRSSLVDDCFDKGKFLEKIVNHFSQENPGTESLIRYGDQYYKISVNEDKTFNVEHLERNSVKEMLRESRNRPYGDLIVHDERKNAIVIDVKNSNGVGGIKKVFIQSGKKIWEDGANLVHDLQLPNINKDEALHLMRKFVRSIQHNIDMVIRLNERHTQEINDFHNHIKETHIYNNLSNLDTQAHEQKEEKLENIQNNLKDKYKSQDIADHVTHSQEEFNKIARMNASS